MHLRTIGEPEHREQCRIRQAGVSIVDEFRHHLSLYGTPLSWKTEEDYAIRYYRDRAVTIRIAQNLYLDYINLRQ